MSYPCSFFSLCVVSHPHLGERVPVGVVLQSRPAEFLGMEVITDAHRLASLVPDADLEMLARYLESCRAIVAGEERGGEIARLSMPERFHWLAAPRSDVIQPTAVEYRTAEDPEALLASLYRERVR